MTDLEAVCRSDSAYGEYIGAYCLCTLSGAVAASTDRQSLFIEEHCFSFPTAASDCAARLLSPRKTAAQGEWSTAFTIHYFQNMERRITKDSLQNISW